MRTFNYLAKTTILSLAAMSWFACAANDGGGENGKVLFNNDGVNTLKKSMSKEDVQEILGQVKEYEIPTRIYVVQTSDGKETYVTNPLIDKVGEKLGITDIFTEGVGTDN